MRPAGMIDVERYSNCFCWRFVFVDMRTAQERVSLVGLDGQDVWPTFYAHSRIKYGERLSLMFAPENPWLVIRYYLVTAPMRHGYSATFRIVFTAHLFRLLQPFLRFKGKHAS